MHAKVSPLLPYAEDVAAANPYQLMAPTGTGPRSLSKQASAHICRTFAQAMLYEMLRRFPAECGLPANARLQATSDFLRSNQDAQRLTSVMEGAVAQFHIDKATSPAGIFYQVLHPCLPLTWA